MSDSRHKGHTLWKWNGVSLHPYSKFDHIEMERFSEKSLIRAQFTQARSLPQHRLYWAILREVVENTSFFNVENLHKVLLVASGVTEPFVDLEGNMSLIPSSIAFHKMDNQEFSLYFDTAMQIIAGMGFDLKDLIREAKASCRWNREAA